MTIIRIENLNAWKSVPILSAKEVYELMSVIYGEVTAVLLISLDGRTKKEIDIPLDKALEIINEYSGSEEKLSVFIRHTHDQIVIDTLPTLGIECSLLEANKVILG